MSELSQGGNETHSRPSGPRWGLVLAAGASRRAGSVKALWDVEGVPAVARCVQIAGDCCDSVVVVLGHHRERIEAEVSFDRATTVVNPSPDRGQTSSVLAGLEAVPAGASVMLWPVDHAFVRAETVGRLAETHRASAPGIGIVVPSWQQRRGHPVVFAAEVADEVRALSPGDAVRTVVRRDEARILHVPTEDAAVVQDFDTLADWERYTRGQTREG